MTTKGTSLALAALGNEVGNGTALAALLLFLAGAAGNGATNLPLPNFLVVDGSYTGAVTEGTFGAPYRTVAAALGAITQSNTTVLVMPGLYAENVSIPTGFTGIALKGTSRANTILAGSGALATVRCAPADAVMQALEISDFIIANTGTGIALDLDGSGGGGGGLSPSFADVVITNCDIATAAGASNTASFTSARRIRINNCTFTGTGGTATQFVNVASAVLVSSTVSDMLVSFNVASATIPTTARDSVQLTAGSVVTGNLTLSVQPSVTVDATSSVGNIVTTGLTISLAPLGGPIVNFQGTQTGTAVPMTFTLPNITGAVVSVVNLDGSTINAPSVGIVLAVGTEPVGSVTARQAKLQNSSGFIALSGGGVINLDVRGMTAKIPVPYTATAGHTVDRDRIVKLGVPIADGVPFTFGTTAPYAVEPPWPAGATYGIAIGQKAAIGAVAAIPFATAFSATTLTFTSTGDTTADITLSRTGQ